MSGSVPTPLPTPPPRCRSKPAPLVDRWHDGSEEDVCPPPFPFCPERTPGAQLDFQKSYSPLEIFKLYFTPDVLQTLCTNTNKYAARKLAAGARTPWTDVTPDEMLNYLSLVVYIGLVQVTSDMDLWTEDSCHFWLDFPSSVMPVDRYEAITAYLHLSDPAADEVNDQLCGQPGHDGLSRVKPLLDDLLTACRAHYHPHQNLVVDERLVAKSTQPTNRGNKLFVLVDSQNGYTCDFSVYKGMAQSPSGNGLSFDAVVGLLKVPHLGTGYHVFVDSFYTSTKLFSHLHQLRFGACGAIRTDCVGFPCTAENALGSGAARGEMRWIREDPLLYVKWKDRHDVAMCSTIHKAYSGESMERRVRDPNGGWAKRVIPLPDPVKEYDEYMGGWGDLSNTLIKYFSLGPNKNQWYKRLFLHFVDIVVVNSFIISLEMAEVKKQKPLKMKSFRKALCEQLAAAGKD